MKVEFEEDEMVLVPTTDTESTQVERLFGSRRKAGPRRIQLHDLVTERGIPTGKVYLVIPGYNIKVTSEEENP